MSSTNEIMIHQLQGVRGSKVDPNKSRYSDGYIVGTIPSSGLAPLDWRAMMVDVSETLAKTMDIPTVGIQAGKITTGYITATVPTLRT